MRVVLRSRQALLGSALLTLSISADDPLQGQDADTFLGRLASQVYELERPVVAIGPDTPTDAEAQALWEACQLGVVVAYSTRLELLHDFVAAHPNSPWTPSIRALLGKSGPRYAGT